jgi:hypothetical protein
VSIDVLLYRDGTLDRSQLEMLKSLRPALAALQSQSPMPPGNLAWHKPTQLLSLDGTHALEVNGGGCHFARLGVDGDAETSALAAGEWAWTYEVDMLDSFKVQRAKVTFEKGSYATKLRIHVSPDRKSWQTVAEAESPTGQPCEATFAPTASRYVRVSALQPNRPNQPGGQMAVAELAVFE